MLQNLPVLRCLSILAATTLLAAGCASESPAPIEVRGGLAQPDLAPVARPGYYIVKHGDTLYSIARQFQRDYHDIAAWNSLQNADVIEAGQELRVVPPGQETPVAAASAPAEESSQVSTVVSIPDQDSLGTPAAIGSNAPATDASMPAAAAPAGLKTEPKGGRLAYSEKVWKDVQAADKAALAAATGHQAAAAPAPEAPASKPVPAATGNSDWMWPVRGKVLATFNDNTNKGLDLAGSIGDPVVAAQAGQVVYVGSGLRGYGKLVIIKHNSSFLSAYAHNQDILVKEKENVQKGQKIATLGKSDTDRPMLHFEIRRQGKPVDPMKYLPPR